MKATVVLAASIGVFCTSSLMASESGSPMLHDSRIQTVPYRSDDVVKVSAARGVALLVVLGDHEKIKQSTTGIKSDCNATEGAEWCIIAKTDDHLIWVKPLSRAHSTDMQVVTERHIYSFEFNAVPAPYVQSAAPIYRLVFSYPEDEAAAKALAAQEAAEEARRRFVTSSEAHHEMDQQIDELTAPKVFQRVNTHYRLAMNKGSSDIQPSEVFDDGRFQFLRFGEGRSVPAVFAVDAKGKESQVNKFWQQGSEYMVLTRLYPQLILRKDGMQVGIWNKTYKGSGDDAIAGSTDPGQFRVVKP